MSLHIAYLTAGDIIKFTVDGTAITNQAGAGTSSSSNPPDGTTPGDWKDFSTVDKGSIKSMHTEEPIMAPSPGVYRRVGILRSGMMHDLEIDCHQVNELILQSVFQTGALVDETASVIQSSLGQVDGWLQLTRSGQKDTTVMLAQLYGILSCDEAPSDGKQWKPKIKFQVLYNALNKLTPSLSAA